MFSANCSQPGIEADGEERKLDVGIGLGHQQPPPDSAHLAGVAGAAQEVGDQALTAILRRIGEEATGFGHRGNAAGQVQINAAKEFAVRRRFRGSDLPSFPGGIEPPYRCGRRGRRHRGSAPNGRAPQLLPVGPGVRPLPQREPFATWSHLMRNRRSLSWPAKRRLHSPHHCSPRAARYSAEWTGTDAADNRPRNGTSPFMTNEPTSHVMKKLGIFQAKVYRICNGLKGQSLAGLKWNPRRRRGRWESLLAAIVDFRKRDSGIDGGHRNAHGNGAEGEFLIQSRGGD